MGCLFVGGDEQSTLPYICDPMCRFLTEMPVPPPPCRPPSFLYCRLSAFDPPTRLYLPLYPPLSLPPRCLALCSHAISMQVRRLLCSARPVALPCAALADTTDANAQSQQQVGEQAGRPGIRSMAPSSFFPTGFLMSVFGALCCVHAPVGRPSLKAENGASCRK